MQDLMQQRNKAVKTMQSALEMLPKRSKDYAAAEKNYRVELRKEMMFLRSEGYPATLVSDLARGKKEIAELKEKRDIAESLMKSANEAINVYKIEVKLIEAQIEREWK